MSHLNPLTQKILPYQQRYPSQPLVQSFTDLTLAQQWRDLEVVELEECGCVVLRGRPKTPKKAPVSVVLPMGLNTPTSLASLTAVLTALATRYPFSSPSAGDVTPAPSAPSTKSHDHDTTVVYLAIVEKDSSIVYYVLKKGIVSPKEVPE